ncbi:MAG TPA: kelch repeat-containing protein [Kofleriaceae bacterium]|nr:kelch repeat-containing protein [Kofleriaceae bacterium]
MGRFVVVIGLLAGCFIEDHTIVCDDRRCPVGKACVPGGCASPDQIAACANLPDDSPCTAGALMGACGDGWCQDVLCGDGKRIGPEVCDDGNQVSGDGCSADCLSKETCGNEYVDTLVGEQCDTGVYGLAADGCSSICTIEIASWSDVSPRAITARYRTAATYDSIRNRVVVFGGFNDEITPTNDTWEWDGTNWREMRTATPPPARAAHAMAFDAARGETVMFGGVGVAVLGDTWLWNGHAWRQAQSPNSPSPRLDAGMAYDAVHQQVVLFGGTVTGGSKTDTWTWDGTSWTEHLVAGPTSGSDLAWDDASQRIIANGTWEWDGSTWSQVSSTKPPGLIVEGQAGHVLAYSSAQLWQWGNGTWTQLAAPTITPARSSSAVAYDAKRAQLVVVGGFTTFGQPLLDDTWEWNGASWNKPASLPQPADLGNTAAAYMPWQGKTLVFGGRRSQASVINNETWQWDGQVWTQRLPANAPSARYDHAMAARTNDVILFGGTIGTLPGDELGDMWRWDGTNWSPISFTDGPSPRTDVSLAYAADRDRIVLYGGELDVFGTTTVYNDTWEWDGTAWTEMHPAHSPAPRTGPVLVYDAASKRVVLAGGSDATGSFEETWEWDGIDWIERTPPTNAPPRTRSAGAYVPTRKSIIMFGGNYGTTFPNDVWEWNGTTWSQLATVTTTHSRFNHALVYDAIQAQVIAIGGSVGPASAFDVAALTFGSAAEPKDVCAEIDSDSDGLVGCEDPDCWGRCSPMCPPGTPCDPGSPHCGDHSCSALEDRYICPDDCN